jgi:hypothetical protein
MDGFENDVSGNVTFEGADNETAILFMDANFIGGSANVGRLYGVTDAMTKGSPGSRPLPRNENRYPEPRALAPEGAQYTIEGVWSFYTGNSMLNAFERSLSWGRMLVPAEDGFVVDLHADRPTVEIFDSARMGKFSLNYITGIKEEGNRSEMTIAADWYSEGDITVNFIFNEDGTVWIDKKPGANAYWWALGRNHVYHRFDPEAEKAQRAGVFQITHVTTADLPLLEMADTEAKVLMRLPKGSGVQLDFQITRNPETADSVPWSRLVLPDGTAGWVFTDTGLQEASSDTAGAGTAKSAAWLFLLLPVPLAVTGFFFAKKLRLKNRGGKPC